MSVKVGLLVGEDSVSVFLNGDAHTCRSDRPNFEEIKQAIADGRYELAVELMKPINLVQNIGNGFSIDGYALLWRGQPVHNVVADRIVQHVREGLPVMHLTNFLQKLEFNPSHNSQQELYKFIEANDLTITPEGDILAYKRVRDDYMDVYSGSISNKPGETPWMPRGQVDDNSRRTCSNGLHVCGFEYLKHYSGPRLVCVSINPRDVVSVPPDYDGSKMRVCQYHVEEELDMKHVIDDSNDVLHKDNYMYGDIDHDDDDHENDEVMVGQREWREW